MINYFLKLYRKKFYCSVNIHDWDIHGLILDPGRRKKNADIVIICKDCENVLTTTLSRTRPCNQYDSLYDLEIFCYYNGYVVTQLGLVDNE